MRVLKVLAVALLCSLPALGQGVYVNLPPITNSMGQPIAGVTVSVFNASGTAGSLTCGAVQAIYSNVTLTTPINASATNTVVTDGFGNFPFYIAASSTPYGYTVSGQGTNSSICYGFMGQLPAGTTPTFSSITSGAATITGALTAGSFLSPHTNKTYVVDGTTFTTIQSAVDAAAAASPPGGKVFLPCGTYTTATVIMPPYPATIDIAGDSPECVTLIPSAANTPLFAISVGFVNTQNAASGGCASNCVTFVSGINFQKVVSGDTVAIGGSLFTVGTVVSNTLMSLTTAPGTQSSVVWDRYGTSSAATGWAENDKFENFTIQAHAASTTDTAGAAFQLSGFRHAHIDWVEYKSDPSATNTVGNYQEVFYHTARPGLEYGTHIDHFKMSNIGFAPRFVSYCDNGGTININNQSNVDYFTNFWIYFANKGPNTVFEHRQCNQFVVRDGLVEHMAGYSSTVSTQNAATGGCAGNCVTQTAGDQFNTSLQKGDPIIINSVTMFVSSVQSGTVLTLTTAPGTQTGVTATFGGVAEDFGQNSVYEGTWSEANGGIQFMLQNPGDNSGGASGSKITNNYQTTPQTVYIGSLVQDVSLLDNTPDNVSVVDNGTNDVKVFGSTYNFYVNDGRFKLNNGASNGQCWDLNTATGGGSLGITGGFGIEDCTNNRFPLTFNPGAQTITVNQSLIMNASQAFLGSNLISEYKGINTTGNGVASVQASTGAVTTGSGTSIGATSLCSTTQCPAGTYLVHAYIDITSACATTGGYIVWLGYTDDGGAKTGSSTTTFIPINGLGTTPATGSLALASTTNYGQGTAVVRTTGAATGGLGSINYGTTASACGSGGPMVGKLYLDVTRLE